MSQMIKIHRAYFSNNAEFKDVLVPLVEEPVANNFYVTGVKGYEQTALVDLRNAGLSRARAKARVYFKSSSDYVIFDGEGIEMETTYVSYNDESEPEDLRSDEEVSNDIADKFETLSLLSDAAAKNKIRAMIVSGTAGTGKTYEVEQAMKARAQKDSKFFYSHIKGSISAVGLYVQLYSHRDGVVILDDSDNALADMEAMQVLKAATESSKKRTVSWKKFSNTLEANDIPQEFEFEGCVVILTNTDLESGTRTKAPHWEAIVSRAHYVNVVLRTAREKVIRIFQVIDNSGILNAYVNPDKHEDVKNFILENSKDFRELSVRTVVKIAELCDSFPEKWQMMAKKTLMKTR